MNMDEILTLVDEIARSYSVGPPSIVKAIIQQESNFNPHVLRYEPEYKYLYSSSTYAHELGITVETEIITQKISWGLGQIMGGLARELGFRDHMNVLLIPEVNIKYIFENIKRIGHQAVTPTEVFACYNGGMGSLYIKYKTGVFPNQKYVESCMNSMRRYENGQSNTSDKSAQ